MPGIAPEERTKDFGTMLMKQPQGFTTGLQSCLFVALAQLLAGRFCCKHGNGCALIVGFAVACVTKESGTMDQNVFEVGRVVDKPTKRSVSARCSGNWSKSI